MYQPEADVHFPQLTVAQTLDFAARIRVRSTFLTFFPSKLFLLGRILLETARAATFRTRDLHIAM